MKVSISLEESIEILKSINISEKTEYVSLLESINKVSAKDLYSKINNPPFNKSAMDGYALNVDKGMCKNNKLQVIGTVHAGEVFKNDVNKNQAIKIMTGAKIPYMCNAVIKKEDVLVKDNEIILLKDVKLNENVCLMGEDIVSNQLLVTKGTKLDYANIGILASSGINEVCVYKKTKIALITTGDELVDISQSLDDGKIYNSNKYSIIARLYELGYNCEVIEHINDDYKNIGDKISSLSKTFDIIITTGGASVGDKDLIEDATKYINGEILFKKVNIKPGSAVLTSKKNNAIIFSLSGNPNAALTTFELLVKPMIERLNGNNVDFLKTEVAILKEDYNKKSNVRRFLRGRLYIEEGVQQVDITQTKSGNGIISSIIGSNCLIEVEKGNTGLKKNQKVKVVRL